MTDSEALQVFTPRRRRARAWPAKKGWGAWWTFVVPDSGFGQPAHPRRGRGRWPAKGPPPIPVACRPVQLSRRDDEEQTVATRNPPFPAVNAVRLPDDL